ncbi:MAG TPA: TrmH family RNA methyltransferase [Candidatus Paceibacterota bacterium]|nr:TrmH family RNA methyltransferase [Candidatus Paceibacterota bacterium]
MKRQICILLHDIRSVYNVGAIFRTADAVGVSKIYLTGYSPTPLDRFGQPRSDFAKCALGAERSVPWEYAKTPDDIVARLKADGFSLLCVEQAPRSVDYKKAEPPARSLVVFGNEVAGISKELLEICDVVAEIPMRGEKESLNVSVSAGIVLFRWFDR